MAAALEEAEGEVSGLVGDLVEAEQERGNGTLVHSEYMIGMWHAASLKLLTKTIFDDVVEQSSAGILWRSNLYGFGQRQ